MAGSPANGGVTGGGAASGGVTGGGAASGGVTGGWAASGGATGGGAASRSVTGGWAASGGVTCGGTALHSLLGLGREADGGQLEGERGRGGGAEGQATVYRCCEEQELQACVQEVVSNNLRRWSGYATR
jgi:hypothetical protein